MTALHTLPDIKVASHHKTHRGRRRHKTSLDRGRKAWWTYVVIQGVILNAILLVGFSLLLNMVVPNHPIYIWVRNTLTNIFGA